MVFVRLERDYGKEEDVDSSAQKGYLLASHDLYVVRDLLYIHKYYVNLLLRTNANTNTNKTTTKTTNFYFATTRLYVVSLSYYISTF